MVASYRQINFPLRCFTNYFENSGPSLLTTPTGHVYPYKNSRRDAHPFVRRSAMIPAEETRKSAIGASQNDQGAASSFGERGVDKPSSQKAATSCPALAYAEQGSEYFNKQRQIPKPRSRGQTPRLDQRLQAIVTQWVSRGLSCRAAARHAGIDHSTISRAAQRDPVFAAALKEARRLGKMRPRLGIRGWRQAAAALQMAGFDPQWTREEKQLLNGTFPGSICWSTLPWPHDERPQD